MTETANNSLNSSPKIPEKEIELAIEVWKTTIEVQEHFNTIEMQIRNLAITVLTAALGAAVLIDNQTQSAITAATTAGKPTLPPPQISIFGANFSPESMIIFAGLVGWLCFYFMDRFWYHRLLQSAVEHGRAIENKLSTSFPYIDLSNQIKQGSPLKIGRFKIHSESKIDLFYLVIALLLLILSRSAF